MRQLNPTLSIGVSPEDAPQNIKKRKKTTLTMRQTVSLSPQHRKLMTLILMVSIALAFCLFIVSSMPRKIMEAGIELVYQASSVVGYRLNDVIVTGRSRTSKDDLLQALNVKQGMPIFKIDLALLKDHLDTVRWIRSVTIERQLPDTLKLVITERKPAALWQKQGRYYVVDFDGEIITDSIEPYTTLPLIVGDKAPKHVETLLKMLSAEPDLMLKFKAAQWISDRRWNIILKGGKDIIEIRLPEDNPSHAWHEVADLTQKENLLDRKISQIDMRIADRMVVKTEGVSLGTDMPVHHKH